MTIAPERVISKDRPSEWEDLPDELLEYLKPDSSGILTKIQKEILDRVLSHQWFFVRNELGANSRWGKRTYLTLGGIELPFNGLTNLILVIQSYDAQTQEALISAMRPGTIEPISERRAKKNIARIQAKGYIIYPSLVE